MIIDCHGHFTTAPPAHAAWREAQLAAYAAGRAAPAYPAIADAELNASVEGQLRRMDERGVDLTLFSPRASAMGHHLGDAAVSAAWARVCNDLIARVVGRRPDRFAGVAQLPQSPLAEPADAVAELRRCVLDLGFVGANLNPDPAGDGTAPPLTDPVWEPLLAALVELDVPAMVHVSTTTSPALHTTGSHYLNADTAVFMQVLDSDLFERLPGLRLVIPHGGGAAPYHWGRFRGLADMLGRPGPETLLANVGFDTCVYHQSGIDLLLDVVGPEAVLFGSETFGAVRGVDPRSGHAYDDTLRYLAHARDAGRLDDAGWTRVVQGNVRAWYPRLDRILEAR